MKEKDIHLTFTEVEDIKDLSTEKLHLVKMAQSACDDAYAPYSHFSVGAAVKCSDGRIVLGNNQENAAYPSGLCAERVAIFSAVSQKPDTAITSIAIAVKSKEALVKNPVAPCGACRQVIAEYEHRQGSKIEIIFTSESGRAIIVNGVGTLLPFAFNSDYLLNT